MRPGQRQAFLALQVIVDVIGDRLDRLGNLMVLHSLRVGLSGKTDMEQAVGFLHDLLEETDLPNEVLAQGFRPEIVEAVITLTRRDDETYREYIERVRERPLAAAVKLNDLQDNLNRCHQLPDLEERVRLGQRWLQAKARLLSD